MSDNYSVAKEILHRLENSVTPKVRGNRALLDQFLDAFRATLIKGGRPNTYTLHLVHGGSAYENLAVSNKADFDVTVCLGNEFVSENFNVDRDEKSGYFTLTGKSRMRHLDCDDYLDASKLRASLFSSFANHAMKAQMPNVTINCSEGLSAFVIELEETVDPWRKVSMDLVPQIPFRTWNQCPDLLPLEKMPKCLRQYIDTTNKNKSPVMFFSMGVPSARNYSNSDQLFNISFSLLEKNFVNSMPELRDMIRILKYIAHRRDWKKKHHFKSFYAKRIAIKYYPELEGKDTWDGCKIILLKLIQEVRNLIIDGHFVGNQPLREWTKEEARAFIQEIETVLKMNLNAIQ